ncbi:glycosyltransferase family 2 protein [Aerosakkonemataceae cyanobacterium BLCC-F50]|uniref:Glycosyltransferase family 2 protein n=1 Tax=Floridaenema flaviceps BLCC-F50 TaxID=3153642 RepID=A0ABV4XUY1_9CYAN
MKTPVALIIFKRPDITARVFEVIRQVKPSKLLIIADGPRADRPDEAEKCIAARAVVENVDWDCEVKRNYSDVNLGCALRPATGISWVFEQVDEAIILEDDCLPHPSFFPYCEELLERYRFDERIMHISANNFCQKMRGSNFSYFFSRYPLSWGWATWKRAWKYYDFSMKLWPEVNQKKLLKDVVQDDDIVRNWSNIFNAAYSQTIDAWDYQWTFTCWLQNGLSILPATSLVTNIGFGSDATHTQTNFFDLDLSASEIDFPLRHPSYMIRDNYLDKLIERTYYDYTPPLHRRLLRKLKKLKKFQL